MSRFTRIFDMLDIIFGKGFMSKNIGKRTNVITLPDENSRRLLTKELAIDKAPDSAIQQGKKDLEKLALDIPKLNDQELLTLTNNAERLAARINPKEFIKRRQRALPKADVIEFANKEKISPEGVMSLTEKIGQKNAPGTLMGNLESRIKQLEASGEDLSKMKGSTLDELMSEVGTSQKGLPALQREGLVRATARDIMIADINSGKLKLPKELTDDILGGGGEPINFFRQFYGEDALEVLDSLSPDFSKLRTSREAADFAKSKFAFEPDLNRPAGSMSVDDAIKAEKEFGINKPEDPEGFAKGGTVSKGLDYLTGIERRGYANGDYAVQAGIKNYLGKQKTATVPIKWKSGMGDNHPDTELAYITKPEKELLIKLDMHNSMPDGEPNIGPGGLISLNSGGDGGAGGGDGGSGDGGGDDGGNGDGSLLTPDLAKNRDYRLYQGSNNPFYSMQANPSGGISNVYTEFKKGGRVRMAGGGLSQGLDYLMGIERRGYQEGGESMVSPDDAMLSYDQAVEKSRQERINKNALAQPKI
jgi:hypothetical protein